MRKRHHRKLNTKAARAAPRRKAQAANRRGKRRALRRARTKEKSNDAIVRDARGRFVTGHSGNPDGKARKGADEKPDAQTLASPEYNRLASYRPYAPQAEFHAAGAIHDERLLMAGNQLGKTLCGGMEWAMHLTGRYPDWWKGKVFNAPVRLWAAGVTIESTRDNPQRVLLGPPQQRERWGTGTIPHDALKHSQLAYSVADCVDSITVRWGGGGDVQQGVSVVSFKSYEKGREKWQGETLDGVWFDEEPPLEIYCEGRTRCVARRGIVMVTFTPLQGMTELVKLFLSEADVEQMRKAAA